MKNKKGFTLVELLAVIAILAILVIIALPNVINMYNKAQKETFLTEAKKVYTEAEKKYISSSINGNTIKTISSEDDSKLDMTGEKLQYCVILNNSGKVTDIKVSNGKWVASLIDGKTVDELTIDDLKDGNLNDYECGPKKPKTFADDDWDTIASVAKSCTENPESCPYSVGNEKEVDLGTYGKHKVRIANLKAPAKEGCGTEGFSQSACGFVLEFVDIITQNKMNSTMTNKDGWPKSQMKTFIDNDIYNSLPNELKSVIIDTKTVSGHGKEDADNFTSTDKLYLLASKEIYSDWSNQYDSAKDSTRQLDYYNSKGVTTSSYDSAIKGVSSTHFSFWWLRCAYSANSYESYAVGASGGSFYLDDRNTGGVSPAFRIG